MYYQYLQDEELCISQMCQEGEISDEHKEEHLVVDSVDDDYVASGVENY